VFRLFLIIFAFVLIASTLEARESPWKRKKSAPAVTPWSAQRSEDRRERRESFIRGLDTEKKKTEAAVVDAESTGLEDPRETNRLPWKKFEDEGKGTSFGQLLLWPIQNGRISSGFGLRSSGFHEGVDIAAPRGTPIRAVSSGIVVFNDRLGTYGRTVIVSHGNGYTSLYAHLDKFFVKRGSRVKQGVVIGSVGNSGRAHGFHLHFEMRKSGASVNPLGFTYQKSSMIARAKGSSAD
jgi:murein DD-endopeptidase MepM/ murein hydrolase activator NlpD